jgi:hypothetical protein
MAKAHAPETNPIESLLAERSQFLNWLARLDAAGEGGGAVPEGVRHRVRADYEARLTAVIEQLRSHSASIAEQLDALRARRADLATRESLAKERMAEAEVRHAVGEFDETKWQEIRGEQTKVLTTTRDELARTTAEIDRLTEVQALVNAPEAAAAPEPEPELMPLPRLMERPLPPREPLAIPPVTAPMPSVMADIPPLNLDLGTPSASPITAAEAEAAAASAARRVSRAAPKREEPQAPARTEWIPNEKPASRPAAPKLDELAFLKSVAPEKPTPKRASGAIPRPAEVLPPATPVVPERATTEGMAGITRADVFASKVQPAIPDPAPAAGGGRASQAAPKTLKCGECGTLNRPTEWYCERCGAELAAL